MRSSAPRFESAEHAYTWLRGQVFPAISEYVRLFKTPQSRQDEYIVIRPLHGEEDDDLLFLPSVYRTDRDINDALLSMGFPVAVLYPRQSDAGNAQMYRDNVLSAWRREPETQRQRITGLCYVPGGAAIIDGKLNTFRDVSVPAIEPPTDDALNDIFKHLFKNICNGRQDYFVYLVQWLAHMVQHPAERPKTAIAVIGDQGTGKGLFIDFIKRMLGGDRNCNTTASSADTKAFNYALANKLFVVFDEATFAGDRQQSDFMKKLVTEARIRVEPKGVDAYEVDNFVRVFITSNNMTSAVPAGIGARRWLIIECRNDVDPAWLKRLATTLGHNGPVEGSDPAYVNWFKWYLETLDISDFDPLALPMQDTGFETKLNVLYKEDPIKAFFWEWLTAKDLTLFRMLRVRDGDGDGQVDVQQPMAWEREVLFGDFYAILTEACKAAYAPVPGPNRIKGALEPFGATTIARGGNRRYVALPHPATCLATLRKTSRFDNPISLQQEGVINKAWAETTDDEVDSLIFRPLTADEEARQGERMKAQAIVDADKRLAKEHAKVAEHNQSILARIFGPIDGADALPSVHDGVGYFDDIELKSKPSDNTFGKEEP